jgi:hypothetical protein
LKIFEAGVVAVGHNDPRRTIYDLIKSGDAGGGEKLYNLGYFNPLNPGAIIGNHFHERMWETYLILSGEGRMHLKDADSLEQTVVPITEVPYRIVVPPRMSHALEATTPMTLLIAATGVVSEEDMFPLKII